MKRRVLSYAALVAVGTPLAWLAHRLGLEGWAAIFFMLPAMLAAALVDPVRFGLKAPPKNR